tara:strand:+ start:696 stop:1064 length:369 start_codon:yes stop_codon:yes gene_type:complete
MPQLSSKVTVHLVRNGKSLSEAKKILDDYRLVMLLDQGQGAIIKDWNVPDIVRPTEKELESYKKEAETLEYNHRIIRSRKRQYKSIEEQLDLIYKDMMNGTFDKNGEWAKHITEVKTANPKL